VIGPLAHHAGAPAGPPPPPGRHRPRRGGLHPLGPWTAATAFRPPRLLLNPCCY